MLNPETDARYYEEVAAMKEQIACDPLWSDAQRAEAAEDAARCRGLAEWVRNN